MARYILTRPLGANLGDWLGFSADEHGLGLGVAITSVIFLAAILATVIYLTVTHADVIEETNPPQAANPRSREGDAGLFRRGCRRRLGVAWVGPRPTPPRRTPPGAEGPPAVITAIAPGQATAKFPPADLASLHTITLDTLIKVKAGDQAGATASAENLETAWDQAQPTLEPMDEDTWTAVDGRIDAVLTSIRAASPDPATETHALDDLLTALV